MTVPRTEPSFFLDAFAFGCFFDLPLPLPLPRPLLGLALAVSSSSAAALRFLPVVVALVSCDIASDAFAASLKTVLVPIGTRRRLRKPKSSHKGSCMPSAALGAHAGRVPRAPGAAQGHTT